MKTFKYFALIVHIICTLNTLVAGLIAIQELFPNKEYAWLIFGIMFASGFAIMLTFFMTTSDWFKTHDELLNDRKKLHEVTEDLMQLRQLYLRNIEKNLKVIKP